MVYREGEDRGGCERAGVSGVVGEELLYGGTAPSQRIISDHKGVLVPGEGQHPAPEQQLHQSSQIR